MKNKKGKKLVVLGAMAALLTLIGVSGSQTYAKYIETAKVSSTQATVAKWGYTVTGDSSRLFGETYRVNTGDETATVYTSGGTVSAQMVGSAHNIVAPGTSGYYVVSVDGQSEVTAQLAFSFAESDLSEIHLGTYYPLTWAFEADLDQDGTYGETGETKLNSNKLQDLLELVDNGVYEFEAGKDVHYKFKLTWTWAFDQGHNAEDTMLAVLANEADSMQYTVSGITSNYPDPADRVTSVKFALSATISQTLDNA